MVSLEVGCFYVAETEGTDLVRFSPKPKRPVLLVHIESGYGAVYPLSTSPSNQGSRKDIELVHELWDGQHIWLVRQHGLFLVPLSRLSPLGKRFFGMRRLKKEGLYQDLADWSSSHRDTLQSSANRQQPEPIDLKLHERIELPEVPSPAAPQQPQPTKTQEPDLFNQEMRRLEIKKPSKQNLKTSLSVSIGDRLKLPEIKQQPAKPTPKPEPSKPKNAEVDFERAVEEWAKQNHGKEILGKPKPPADQAPKPEPPKNPEDEGRLRRGFRRRES